MIDANKVKNLIKLGIKKRYIQIENNRVIYPNGKSYDFKKPEEPIRAASIVELIEKYKYPKKRIDTNICSPRREPKLPADIVVFKDNNLEEPYIVIETKSEDTKAKLKEAKREGLGNANLWTAPFLLIQCGSKKLVFDLSTKVSLKSLDKHIIADIPVSYGKTPKYRFKKADPDNDLVNVDFKELSNIFQKCHNIIWAGGKRDPATAFDEMSKIMFAKLYNERNTKNGQYYKFQVGTNESEEVIANRIKELYDKAREVDPTVFTEEINLDDEKIFSVVKELQDISLIKTDLDSKGRAFEQFLSEIFRGKLGQYFTRRELVEFAIQMIQPTDEDVILDPACGSGGFLLYALKKVNDDIEKDYKGDMDTIKRKQYDFSHYNVYGIEINDKIARVAMMDMVIHEDGHTNIEENTALNSYFKNHNIKFNHFTLILTNPPFGNSVREGDRDKLGNNKLKNFKICKTQTPKSEKPEILFLERCYDFLKSGGRIGIVTPEGILNNPSKKYVWVREWLKKHFKILAIISLPEFAFKKTGSGERTSLLFMEKKEIPTNDDDYEIFLGVARKIGYDATGKPQSNELPLIAECYHERTESSNVSVLLKKLSEMRERLDPRHYDPVIDNMINKIKSLEKYNDIKVVELSDLLYSKSKGIQKGKSFDEKIESDGRDGVPFIEIKNITQNGIIFGEGVGALEDKYVLKKWYQEKKEYQLEEGDILVAITGATIGKTAIVKNNNIPATFCGDVTRIRLDKEQCDPLYVESFLRSRYGQLQIYKWINGSTNLHLSPEFIKRIVISIQTEYGKQSIKIEEIRREIIYLKTKINHLRKEEEEYFNGLIKRYSNEE
jgi:type I restriction enzyme M protein